MLFLLHITKLKLKKKFVSVNANFIEYSLSYSSIDNYRKSTGWLNYSKISLFQSVLVFYVIGEVS